MTGPRCSRRGVHAEVRGREEELLRLLGIDPAPPRGATHRRCPFPDHADERPSWRWDVRRRRWYCTCAEKGGTAIDAVMRVEGLGFAAAAARARQLLRLEGSGQREGDPPPSGGKARNRATGGLKLSEYAAAKRLRERLLADLGCATVHRNGAPAVRIPYRDREGREAAVRYRHALEKGEDGDGRFAWQRGAKLILYGLWRLPEGIEEIVLVEGESDAHTLWQHGIPALGLPGAGTWREERDAPQLASVKIIYIVVEPDHGGAAVEAWLAKSAIRDRARLVALADQKDPSGLHCADPEQFKERWLLATRRAVPWADREARLRDQLRRTLWASCRSIAQAPDILGRFARDLATLGVVGEEINGRLIYLAITSRLLSRPVSVAVKGPSGSGKSHTTERVLDFFPPSAFLKMTSLSDKALIYTDEDLRHRFLVILELSGMESEGLAYLIRTLLSEGFVEHMTVEKEDERHVCRRLRKDGPTGLIVTTTRNALHPENETRLLSLTTTDTQEQTRKILAAMAADQTARIDLTPWRALQAWLELADREVTIPFASALAAKVRPVAVRLRRDFGALLSLVRAHAILHQASRERDPAGRIVARIDDYAGVRGLIADLVAEGVGATVKPETRETVEAVARLAAAGQDPVTYELVGGELRLDRSSAMRRCRVALAKGYLVNDQQRKGQPARLRVGSPLPDDAPLLPDPEQLRGCATEDAPATDPQPGQAPEPERQNGSGCAVAPESRGQWGAPPPVGPGADQLEEFRL